jgi:hypothetical protein
MRPCFKHAHKALCGAVVLGLSGILSGALAAEFEINDPETAPFTYLVCYAVADAMNPGPAAHYGEDVCVDYVATIGGGNGGAKIEADAVVPDGAVIPAGATVSP